MNPFSQDSDFDCILVNLKKYISFLLVLIILFTGLLIFNNKRAENYGAPPYVEDDIVTQQNFGKYGDLSKWTRPDGPLRVGLQAGHWKNSELPDELKRLRESGGGTSSGTVTEWEVNLAIAQEAKKILENSGIVVDILPATIPPGYLADAFIAIHADGSTSLLASGFKVAAPRRDFSGKASELVSVLENNYKIETGLPIDPNITRNMTGYYAFSSRRFEHSIHPMTPAVILETGFLTNPSEARMLIKNPELPASAIAKAVKIFLDENK